jgi:hypothetical protein
VQRRPFAPLVCGAKQDASRCPYASVDLFRLNRLILRPLGAAINMQRTLSAETVRRSNPAPSAVIPMRQIAMDICLKPQAARVQPGPFAGSHDKR